jgi:hypothetical protein
MSATPFPLLPAAISLSGVVLLGLASVLYRRKKSKYDGWTATNGRLDSFKEEQGRHGKVFAPIVTFSDSSGQKVAFTSRLASSNKRFEVGDDVPVLYSPSDSSQAIIHRALDLYFIEILLGVAGAWNLLAGPLIALLLRWR